MSLAFVVRLSGQTVWKSCYPNLEDSRPLPCSTLCNSNRCQHSTSWRLLFSALHAACLWLSDCFQPASFSFYSEKRFQSQLRPSFILVPCPLATGSRLRSFQLHLEFTSCSPSPPSISHSLTLMHETDSFPFTLLLQSLFTPHILLFTF